jgi:hypothetical protein
MAATSAIANMRAVSRVLSRWVEASWRMISDSTMRKSSHQIAASVWSGVRTVLVAEPRALTSFRSRA